jgi:mannose-6-phosphate isomerase-like protein (cupin superfamily)
MGEETRTSSASAGPIVVQPGAGRGLPFPTGAASVMLGGEQTGGMLTVIYNTVAPGDGPPPMSTPARMSCSSTWTGTSATSRMDSWTEVGPGGVVYLPRGTAHCYRNLGATPGHQWLITTPAGFERFFARFAEEPARAEDGGCRYAGYGPHRRDVAGVWHHVPRRGTKVTRRRHSFENRCPRRSPWQARFHACG